MYLYLEPKPGDSGCLVLLSWAHDLIRTLQDASEAGLGFKGFRARHHDQSARASKLTGILSNDPSLSPIREGCN